MLGKRPRPPMKRTTSMTEITLDLNSTGDIQPSGTHKRQTSGVDGLDQWLSATISPRNQRSSSDFVETANFLRSCSFCERRLVPGRDIYMYRGDSGFCSLECRQKQMSQDERKEKCSLASKKQVLKPTAGSQVSPKGETVAA
ncbi:Protein of unknown function (DUF581) [Quillaja saponaria]|uniref:FLZ-type domain-containing protein n=1 Tax=Quillaja saponaria TaxID=32244 RepID=A0AAD7LJE2_QUISA|nr:Protein of unknown function (DUF581) [Quillaja saponaria]